MKLPTQAKPVTHAAHGRNSNGIAASTCGCPNVCLGLCLFGNCQGICA